MLEQAIEKALSSAALHPKLKEVMIYAVLPAGKLFRPKLVEAIAKDTHKSLSQNHLHLAAAIELHHAYTLVHDDLPAMDNDATRRGKPSTHVQFGEWQAILTGDALLIASFAELMKIDHPNLKTLHKVMTWCTGAKGLIAGQFMDLAADGKLTLPEVIRIHELKTARLIQAATLGAHLLHKNDSSLKEKISFMRLGKEIGVSFQLLDDLTELTDETISPHEKMINPFLISPKEALDHLFASHLRLEKLLKAYQLTETTKMLDEYFRNSQSKLSDGIKNLETNMDPAIHQDMKSWITTFVRA